MNSKFAQSNVLKCAALLAVTLAIGIGLWISLRESPRASGPLPHEVYVWQRAWTAPVQEAVAGHATNFNAVVALGAEVTWIDGSPKVTPVALDYALLAQSQTAIGLALRIGSYGGPFNPDDRITQFLAEVASAMITEARTNGIKPAELQLDFDCAESKLAGYGVWLRAIQKRVAPVPVTITALPSWLGSPVFRTLARQSTNYVLQVHSLERPRDVNQPFTLCDAAAAQRAVERAGTIGIPFRVALPTYGYLLAFDPGGKFIGLSAEGPAPAWPTDAQIRELRSDPIAMAGLVDRWQTNRPAALRGVIWYRLPVAVDNLNWRWPTLGTIVGGGSLRESLRAESRRVEAGLIEINLVNDGSLDISSRLTVTAHWPRESGARLVASDDLNGFTLQDKDAYTVEFQTDKPGFRHPAGETRLLGWLRFDRDCEVQLEIERHY